MKRKIIALLVWIIVSILYCLNAIDTGRSVGARINGAIEHHVESYTKEYAGAEGVADAYYNAYVYSESYDLKNKFKMVYGIDSVITVIYVGVSAWCYHYGFTSKDKKERTEEKMSNEERSITEDF